MQKVGSSSLSGSILPHLIMPSAEEKLAALREFRGDVDVYSDGSIQLRPYTADQSVVGGVDWDVTLERLIKSQRRNSKKI